MSDCLFCRIVSGEVEAERVYESAGAIAFLVPPEEERDARHHAGSMRIIVVRTVDDALAALQQLGGAPLPVLSTTSTTTH